MIALVLFVAFGIAYAIFATQNTGTISVSFGQYILRDVPLYLALLASFALGLVFSSVFYGVKTLFSQLSLRRGHSELKRARQENAELTKDIHKLELENAKLHSQLGDGETGDDDAL